MKKLEELLNLSPMPEIQLREDTLPELGPEESSLVTMEEKVEHALTVVGDLNIHDAEMDRIAQEALESYEEFKQFGLNSSEAHAGKILDSATAMLKTALEARDSKAQRRMKTLDLQLKKMRLDLQKLKNSDESHLPDGGEFDRNHLLRLLAGNGPEKS